MTDLPLDVSFTTLDWAVVIAAMVCGTLIGVFLTARKQTTRDFFLGGRRLPWWAVSASIVSTQLSGSTFVALPFLAYRTGGDLTFLMLPLIGALLSRLIVAKWVLPALFKREIESPYELIRARLGKSGHMCISLLFIVSCVLVEAGRLYAFGLLIRVLLDQPLSLVTGSTGIPQITLAVMLIAAVSVLWTLMGGVVTVVWTDVIMTLMFTAGALVSLAVLMASIEGGWSTIWHTANEAGKLTLWNASTSLTQPYTLYTASIAATFAGIGTLAFDQSIAQKLLCCKNLNHARLALISSWLGVIVPVSCIFVGVLLWVFVQQNPLTPAQQALVDKQGDYVFALFVGTSMPSGVAGLVMASVLAAAIPTSALSALSQAAVALMPWSNPPASSNQTIDQAELSARAQQHDRKRLWASRWMVLVFGVLMVLGTEVFLVATSTFKTIIDTVFALAGFAGGPIMGAFLLAWLNVSSGGRVFCFGAVLSLALTSTLAFPGQAIALAAPIFVLALILVWAALCFSDQKVRSAPYQRLKSALAGSLILFLFCLLLNVLKDGLFFAPSGTKPIPLAWPWYVPIGAATTALAGGLLSRVLVISTASKETQFQEQPQ